MTYVVPNCCRRSLADRPGRPPWARLLGGALVLWLIAAPVAALEFSVRLDPKVASQPVAGRLFVLLSAKQTGEPRFGPDWFAPEPFFGVDVSKFIPGETVTIDHTNRGFPTSLSGVAKNAYRIQAVLHINLDRPDPGRAPGNFYSEVKTEALDGQSDEVVRLTLNQVVAESAFPETKWIRELRIRGDLLTRFHGRPIEERVAVVLPAAYFTQPQRRFPVIYSVPGFGGSHREALRYQGAAPEAANGDEDFIQVMLDGRSLWGHHVYADSANNGPRGRALIEEIIPEIDRQFRTVAAPEARFLTGHSSGGWSSLWLQVEYPDSFGGVWSTAPDPVDFRDFQRIDIYAEPPQSVYIDPAGQRRPIARRDDRPVLWFDDFCRMDDVLRRGGQLRSFEAVFSPRGEDGEPLRLWNRLTGEINPEVARAWESYDIRLKLERQWPTLGPKLAGKLHIVTGELDTFYLEGAVKRLQSTLSELGSDARIEIVAGANHATVRSTDLLRRIRREMSEAFRRYRSSRESPPAQ